MREMQRGCLALVASGSVKTVSRLEGREFLGLVSMEASLALEAALVPAFVIRTRCNLHKANDGVRETDGIAMTPLSQSFQIRQ